VKELTKREIGKIKTFLRNLCYEVPYGFSTFVSYSEMSTESLSYEYRIEVELNHVYYKCLKWKKEENTSIGTRYELLGFLPLEKEKIPSEIIQKIGKRKILETLLKDIDRYIKDCNKCKEYILKHRRK
jgi:hypothetical protein